MHVFSESLLYIFRFYVCLPLKGFPFTKSDILGLHIGRNTRLGCQTCKINLVPEFSMSFYKLLIINKRCLSSEVVLKRNLGNAMTCTVFCKLQVNRTKLRIFLSHTMWSRINGSFSLMSSLQVSRNLEKHRNLCYQ